MAKADETLTEDLNHLREARNALRSARGVPFVWDIAFVEILTGEKGGFDIVIGNPPYVRQESIADPNLRVKQSQPKTKRDTRRNLPARCIKPFRASLATDVRETSDRIIRQPLSLTNWMPKATSTSISIFTDFPSSIRKGRSVSSHPIRGSMSATEKISKSLPSSTATSSRLSTTRHDALSHPPM